MRRDVPTGQQPADIDGRAEKVIDDRFHPNRRRQRLQQAGQHRRKGRAADCDYRIAVHSRNGRQPFAPAGFLPIGKEAAHQTDAVFQLGIAVIKFFGGNLAACPQIKLI